MAIWYSVGSWVGLIQISWYNVHSVQILCELACRPIGAHITNCNGILAWNLSKAADWSIMSRASNMINDMLMWGSRKDGSKHQLIGQNLRSRDFSSCKSNRGICTCIVDPLQCTNGLLHRLGWDKYVLKYYNRNTMSSHFLNIFF